MNQTAKQLADKKCQPCEGVGNALTKSEAQKFLKDLPEWQLNAQATGISRDYVMKNFMAAVKLINEIARVAETENHHPDFHLTSYRKLRVDLSTHAVKGLSENDFILATKINQLPAELKQ